MNLHNSAPIALQMRAISKSYLGTKALTEVDFDCRSGEVHALLGENGAGKSTLAAIIAGAVKPDRGSMMIGGSNASFASPDGARLQGIAVVYQELVILPNLTVEANVWLHREPNRFGFIDSQRLRSKTLELLESLSVSLDPEAIAAALSVTQQQLLEIARAMSYAPRILVMDEPTSSLGVGERREVLQLIRRLKATGVAVVYISHRLEEVFDIADRVTILRDGKVAARLKRAEVTRDKVVHAMIGGKSTREIYPARSLVSKRAPLLEISNLSLPGVLEGISFSVARGEILGIWGLVGSGRSTLLRAIFGVEPEARAQIRVGGRNVSIRSPRDAVRLGIALLGEDRRRDGLFLNLGTVSNLTAIWTSWRYGLRRPAAEIRWAEHAAGQVHLGREHLRKRARELSGGNQQKVVLGKWLAAAPNLFLLDDPTKGIDVGAKTEIYALMRRFADKGAGLLFVSSEMPELLNTTDRILVLRRGRVVDTVVSKHSDETQLMRAAIGAAQGGTNE